MCLSLYLIELLYNRIQAIANKRHDSQYSLSASVLMFILAMHRLRLTKVDLLEITSQEKVSNVGSESTSVRSGTHVPCSRLCFKFHGRHRINSGFDKRYGWKGVGTGKWSGSGMCEGWGQGGQGASWTLARAPGLFLCGTGCPVRDWGKVTCLDKERSVWGRKLSKRLD